MEILLEWCADMFGVTTKSRLGLLVMVSLLVALGGFLLYSAWGMAGAIPMALVVWLAAGAAREVAAARSAVWRAACLQIDAPGQRPADPSRGRVAPSAASLQALAIAVDDVRRGEHAAAHDMLLRIERGRLRQEEVQLFEAARAMISLGLGDSKRAAQQAVVALPTGSEDLDTSLGRAVVADAWQLPERLAAIDAAWDRTGVANERGGSMSRLSRLVKVRIDTSILEGLEADEARELSDEARAVGDDDLAAQLDARARHSAYR